MPIFAYECKKCGEEFELLTIHSLDEFTMATPAIVGDRLLVRTQSRLYSIRDLTKTNSPGQ